MTEPQRFKHIARQFEFIVVKKFLIVANSLVTQGVPWQCASRSCEVRFYERPELGKVHSNGTIQRLTLWRN